MEVAMMWFGGPSPKERLYENILKFRTHNTVIRTWVERGPDGPQPQADWDDIDKFITENKQSIDAQDYRVTADLLCTRFPRICAVEIMSGSQHLGVLLYPRWP
jgi:hypothetical protein